MYPVHVSCDGCGLFCIKVYNKDNNNNNTAASFLKTEQVKLNVILMHFQSAWHQEMCKCIN